ncbi:MAG: penicillin-binding protein activator, partial [Gammaproteobacteria bacterium]|nr:penicillin-binding protein activator [Gammaproteobacteria bacterium]
GQLEASLELEAGNLTLAAKLAAELAPANGLERMRVGTLTARIAAAAGNYAAAAAALMLLLPSDSDDPQRLSDTIWSYAQRTPAFQIQDLIEHADNRPSRAWWQLSLATNGSLTVRAQHDAWTSWRARNAYHLASQYPPGSLLAESPAPARNALMVPLTGTLASAGQAVRDGFIAAYFQSRPTLEQDLIVYDSASAPMNALYEQALLQEADIIVGPLSKANVEALAAIEPVIPVVALNSLPPKPAPGLVVDPLANPIDETPPLVERPPAAPRIVQFPLAVEDEASAIAERITRDGHRRILFFRGNQGWAARGAQQFDSDLGTQTEVVGFGVFNDPKEVTAVVGDVLLVAESNARNVELRRILGKQIEFIPRRRHDAEAVVALVDRVQMATLKPALRFHFARDLPIYTASQAVRDGGELSSLNGVRVCDIPWRLHPSDLEMRVKNAFRDATGPLGSLYALGIDAFRVINHLAHLTQSPAASIVGSTGRLRLDADGRIRRSLDWALVRNGRFTPLPAVVPGP